MGTGNVRDLSIGGARPELTIVVEGIGNIVQEQYRKALKVERRRYGNRLRIIFTNQSPPKSSKEHEKAQEEEAKFISSLTDGWAEYLDKGNDTQKLEYVQLRRNSDKKVVVIATPDVTHINITFDWLEDSNNCEAIYVEKPIDSSPSRALDLLHYIRKNDNPIEIYPLDHYLPRLSELKIQSVYDEVLENLDNNIVHADFHVLEDRSVPFEGVIEATGRLPRTLEKGLILDLFPHVLAMVDLIGDVSSIRLSGLKVARYDFRNRNGEIEESVVKRETYADVDFSFLSYKGLPISATTKLGKGVNGSSGLKITGDLKRARLVGANLYSYLIDLKRKESDSRESTKFELYDGKNQFVGTGPEILDDPYGVIVERIVSKHLNNISITAFWLSVETAVSGLMLMERMSKIVDKLFELEIPIPLYHITTEQIDGKDVSIAPTLEEINGDLRDKSISDLLSDSSMFDEPWS